MRSVVPPLHQNLSLYFKRLVTIYPGRLIGPESEVEPTSFAYADPAGMSRASTTDSPGKSRRSDLGGAVDVDCPSARDPAEQARRAI